MRRVFISYSTNDRNFVDWLVERLSKEGISVWYDQNEVKVGDSIVKRIKKGIESSSIILIVLSKSSTNSKWVSYELNEALFYSAQRQGIRIIPVKIEEAIIPSSLSYIQYADFTQNRELALHELILAINESEHKVFQTPNWDELDPRAFDNLVYDLLVKEGFEVIPQAEIRDRGIDFVAFHKRTLPGNGIPQVKWLVETKFHKDSKLSVHSIAQVYGIAKLSKTNAVLLVTNSYLTNAARDFNNG